MSRAKRRTAYDLGCAPYGEQRVGGRGAWKAADCSATKKAATHGPGVCCQL
jgi:hypothetical protein